MRRKLAIVAATLLVAVTAPWAILFSVNAAMGEAPAAFRRDRCTRHCHDRGCRHEPLLPAALTSSSTGLFGRSVRALHVMGSWTGLGPGRGYGAVNILIFCLLWPGLMLCLVGIVAWQRLRIAGLGGGATGPGPRGRR